MTRLARRWSQAAQNRFSGPAAPAAECWRSADKKHCWAEPGSGKRCGKGGEELKMLAAPPAPYLKAPVNRCQMVRTPANT
jgi:hypothetical protein